MPKLCDTQSIYLWTPSFLRDEWKKSWPRSPYWFDGYKGWGKGFKGRGKGLGRYDHTNRDGIYAHKKPFASSRPRKSSRKNGGGVVAKDRKSNGKRRMHGKMERVRKSGKGNGKAGGERKKRNLPNVTAADEDLALDDIVCQPRKKKNARRNPYANAQKFKTKSNGADISAYMTAPIEGKTSKSAGILREEEPDDVGMASKAKLADETNVVDGVVPETCG